MLAVNIMTSQIPYLRIGSVQLNDEVDIADHIHRFPQLSVPCIYFGSRGKHVQIYRHQRIGSLSLLAPRFCDKQYVEEEVSCCMCDATNLTGIFSHAKNLRLHEEAINQD